MSDHCMNVLYLRLRSFVQVKRQGVRLINGAVICQRGAAGPSKSLRRQRLDAINLLVKRSHSVWCRARKRAVFLNPSAIVDSDSVRILFTTVLRGRFLAIQRKPTAIVDIPWLWDQVRR